MKKKGKTKGKKATAVKDLPASRSKTRGVKGGEVNNPLTQAPSQRLIPQTGTSTSPLRQSPIPK